MSSTLTLTDASLTFQARSGDACAWKLLQTNPRSQQPRADTGPGSDRQGQGT